ncbi:MAG: signal peptidase I [Treponemataceae bacterium]
MATNIYDFDYMLKKKFHKKISFIVLLITLFLFVSSLSVTFLLFPIFVNSSSMEPNLDKNNIVFVCPLLKPDNPIFRHSSPIQRGDLVYLTPLYKKRSNFFFVIINKICKFFTFQQLSPFTYSQNMSENHLIRRVVAIPGDTVYVKDYSLYVKERGSEHFLTEFELSKKDYDILIEDKDSEEKKVFNFFKNCEQIQLGDNDYFFLADNRVVGVDSRIWGAMNSKQIEGKVVMRYFPFTKVKVF